MPCQQYVGCPFAIISVDKCFFFLSESYMYHLRVYVYQGRNLCAMDKDSFSGNNKVEHCDWDNHLPKMQKLAENDPMKSTHNTLVCFRSLCPRIVPACEQDHRSHSIHPEPHMGSDSHFWGHWNIWGPTNYCPQSSWCVVGAVWQWSSCTLYI